MTTKTLGRTGLAALAGLLMMAAAPSFAQDQNQSGSPQSQSNPDMQNNPGEMQNSTGAAEHSGMTTNPAMGDESLSEVQNPSTTLASDQVQDTSGQQLGQVSRVHTTRSGRPTRIDITLISTNGGRAKTVSVTASRLRFNRGSHTLITNLTPSDLQAMPAATSTSM